MTNRREFLQIGAAATAWPIVAGAAHAAGVAAPPQLTPLFAAIYDPRFPESVAFSSRSAALGMTTLPIAADGDMTGVWYDVIYRRWQEGPVAIGGCTAHGPMFCFAELARDVRMRVVFRTEHRMSDGAGAHALRGPISMLAKALPACAGREPLGAAMADVVARLPAGRHEITSAARRGVPLAGPLPEDGVLYTWVIAPAVRA